MSEEARETVSDVPTTTEDATGQTQTEGTGEQKGGSERTYTEAEVQAQIKDRLDRERRKQERDQAKQKEESEAQALEARAEWEELAKKRQVAIHKQEATIGELMPKAERAETLEKVVIKYAAAEREGLPQHILSLLDRMPVEEQLEWISENREQLAGEGQETTAPRSGAPDTTRKNGEPKDSGKSFNDLLRNRGLTR